jgi:DNA repair protein RecO (recombination protein O)
MIVKTDAVVLRTMKYRESSRIATLYTRDSGKMSVIAKGIREHASRFGGSLDVLAYVSVVVYRKEHRDLQLLTRCDMKKPFRHLSEEIDRMAAALAAIELLDAVTHAAEENAPLFTLLVETLDAIDSAARNVVSPLLFFELHLLAALGYRPNVAACFRCGAPLEADDAGPARYALNSGSGGLYCDGCAPEGAAAETVSAGTLRSLQHLQALGAPHDAARVALSPRIREEVSWTLRRLLQCHVEGLRPSKSEAVFAALAQS